MTSNLLRERNERRKSSFTLSTLCTTLKNKLLFLLIVLRAKYQPSKNVFTLGLNGDSSLIFSRRILRQKSPSSRKKQNVRILLFQITSPYTSQARSNRTFG